MMTLLDWFKKYDPEALALLETPVYDLCEDEDQIRQLSENMGINYVNLTAPCQNIAGRWAFAPNVIECFYNLAEDCY